MTGTHGVSAGDPTGPHKSHLSNKADPRVDSDNIGGVGNTRSTGGYGGSDPRGPHDSAFANKLDPRVDTDQVGGYGNTAGAGGGYKGSDPTGPHDSRLANKLDPRVDSDNYGGYGNTQSTGGAGRTNLTGQHTTGGLTGNQNTTGGLTGNQHTQYSDPTGPHDSHLGNKADPRVDSDRVGLAGNTQGTGGYGHTGTHHTTGGLTGNQHTQYSDPTGPHDSHLGNTMDPRVDSDRVGPAGNTRGAGGIGHTGAQHTTGGLTGGTHTGVHNGGHLPGPADKTAGPHKSDMLNSKYLSTTSFMRKLD